MSNASVDISEETLLANMKTRWFLDINSGRIESIEDIIDKGVDINIKDKGNNTGLTLSAMLYRPDIFKIILNTPGVDINYQNINGNNALLYGVIFDKRDIINSLLIRPEIDITVVNINGNNIFHYIKDKDAFINYKQQKKILKNNREDILIEFNNHGLIHPDIKKEYPDLFSASDWGLI
jgi:ankyrin repeat protein